MALVDWVDVMSSPDYQLNLQRLTAAAARQHRAIPSAAPEVRQAALQEGARLGRLRELESGTALANRRLQLQERELDLGGRIHSHDQAAAKIRFLPQRWPRTQRKSGRMRR